MIFIKFEIFIKTNQGIFDITNLIINKFVLTMHYKDAPSYLNINFLKQNFDILEGDAIYLKINQKNIFFGYIFNINIKNNSIYSIKAYDQIRYLLARDTYIYNNKSASQLLSMICDDFSIQKGHIENTNYSISYRIEENQTILNILYTALDITQKMTSQKFVLYDDFGKICLKNFQSMKQNIFFNLDEDVFDYQINKSIDKDVFNSVKVSVKNKKNKIISTYLKENDNKKLAWGTLRYFERLPNNFSKAQALNYANNILVDKCKSKFWVYFETLGNFNVRAGSILNIIFQNNIKEMLVDKCEYILENNTFNMRLKLVDF